MFCRARKLLIGTSDETYQHVLLTKPVESGPPKKVNLLRLIIENKATIRIYEEMAVMADGSLVEKQFDKSVLA